MHSLSRSFLLLTITLLAPSGLAQPALREDDRVRLAEAFHLAEAARDPIWPGWSEIPFAILLVTPEHEFLVRHPRPSDDFEAIGYDELLRSEVYVRARQFPPNLLASFPAVGGVPTVVIGQPEQTGKSSTFWVVTALHEHFHQFQDSRPGHYEAVAALDLAGGDETGMWMLNYPFPYDSAGVVERFSAYRDALRRALGAVDDPELDTALADYLAARSRFRESIGEQDYRYFSFQLWKEGVARYIEYRVAELASEGYQPLPAFQALEDYVPYAEAADALRRTLDEELEALDLADWKRIAFYPIGAAEALLLDRIHPGWQRRYFEEPFYLERYHEGG